MSAASKTLTHCPVCRYNLTGLPRNHRCPECGFEYDESTVVWRPPIIPRSLLFAAWLLLYALVRYRCDWLLIQGLGFHPGEASVIVLSLSAVPSFIGLYYPRGLITLSERGVTFRFLFRSVHFVPWRQILVEPNRPTLYVVEGRARRALILPATGMAWGRRRRLHAIIAERWKAAGGADGERSGAGPDAPDGFDAA